MLDFFHFDFLIRGFIAGLALGVVAPVVGLFLVVRRYSLLADALAHVSLLGVAIGLLSGINPLVSALAVSGVAAVGMERLRRGGRIMGESVLAVFLSGSLALAVVLISLARGFNINLLSYLFGSLITVTMTDLWFIGGLSVLIIGFVTLKYRQLFLSSLDADLAQTSGVSVTWINLALLLLAAGTVTLAMRMVGVLLVGALMVIPVLAAMQFRLSFLRTLFLAVLFSVVSVVAGFFLAYTLNLASGGTIVLVTLFLFVLSLLVNKK